MIPLSFEIETKKNDSEWNKEADKEIDTRKRINLTSFSIGSFEMN